MDPHECALLQARLRSVERRLYVASVGWVLSVVLVLLLGLMVQRTASQPQVVRAQAVEIFDATGRVRITLDAVNRKPSLWLYDAAGQRRTGLTVSAHGTPELVLNDADGRVRMALRVGLERAAELRLTDALGRPRIGLWVGYDEEPGVWFFDELERARIGMRLIGGAPRLWFFDHPTGRLLFSAP